MLGLWHKAQSFTQCWWSILKVRSMMTVQMVDPQAKSTMVLQVVGPQSEIGDDCADGRPSERDRC